MQIEHKIGQMLLFGWQGSTDERSRSFNKHAERLISEFNVGGVIIMGRNVGTPDRLRHTIRDLQLKTKANGNPSLFVAVDQEGGRVLRLQPPYWPVRRSAFEIGKTNDPGEARREAASIGEDLKSVGINWNFAPVMDVNNNPHNPVIGDRSYSVDPTVVSAMGIATIEGYQIDNKIMACAKHFPGHGDTAVDSHFALPIIPHNMDRLNACELVPFEAAIKHQTASIMTSHILFPALDPLLPATLSASIINELLRARMGFNGIVVTDCLEMRGVADQWGSSEAAVLSVIAGADILLCCHTEKTQYQILQALLAALRSGRLTESRIDESLDRINKAKNTWIH